MEMEVDLPISFIIRPLSLDCTQYWWLWIWIQYRVTKDQDIGYEEEMVPVDGFVIDIVGLLLSSYCRYV